MKPPTLVMVEHHLVVKRSISFFIVASYSTVQLTASIGQFTMHLKITSDSLIQYWVDYKHVHPLIMSGKIVNSSSQWWVMDAKEESLGTATLSWVCIAILFIVESQLTKQ